MEGTTRLTDVIGQFRVTPDEKSALLAIIAQDGGIGTIGSYMRLALKMFIQARRTAERKNQQTVAEGR